jgi:hypothetical protein
LRQKENGSCAARVRERADDDVLAFLEKWIEDNAVATPARMRAERAENLAEQCRKEAEEAGFSEEALDEAVGELAEGGDLSSYIEEALEKAEEDDGDYGDDEEEDA